MYEWYNGKGSSFKWNNFVLWDFDFIMSYINICVLYVYSKQLVVSLFFVKTTTNVFYFKGYSFHYKWISILFYKP